MPRRGFGTTADRSRRYAHGAGAGHFRRAERAAQRGPSACSGCEPPMTHRPFTSLLIANRGEIACRIARTAKRMGLRTIAVYSEADAAARHVQMADEAHLLGAAPPRESYLNIDRIIAAAKAQRRGSHPSRLRLPLGERGFRGSLRGRRADFRGAARPGDPRHGLESHRQGADGKGRRAHGARLSWRGAGYRDLRARGEADRLSGAAQGGRGRRRQGHARGAECRRAGSRRDRSEARGEPPLSATTGCCSKSSSSGRAISRCKFSATATARIVSLFERECTLQRRHQKVIEEAPSAALDDERREALYEAARKAAAAIGYVGAGTVEFVAGGRTPISSR